MGFARLYLSTFQQTSWNWIKVRQAGRGLHEIMQTVYTCPAVTQTAVPAHSAHCRIQTSTFNCSPAVWSRWTGNITFTGGLFWTDVSSHSLCKWAPELKNWVLHFSLQHSTPDLQCVLSPLHLKSRKSSLFCYTFILMCLKKNTSKSIQTSFAMFSFFFIALFSPSFSDRGRNTVSFTITMLLS